jgi:hypothetical protein
MRNRHFRYRKIWLYPIRLAAALAILFLMITSPFGKAPAQTPFGAFLAVMETRESISRTETGESGYLYSLSGGILTISLADGREIWRSDAAWWVDDFRLGDVNGDGAQDVLFSLWKSYRFGNAKPARMENNDDRVRHHLFLYTVMPGHVREIWCSSDLPRPIYHFELDPSGEITPVSSGMLLRTEEGEYAEDFSRTQAILYQYAWQGWGFVPVDASTKSEYP